MKYQKKNCKVVFYSDELNDDFAGTNVKKKKQVDGKFVYIRKNIFFRIGAFILYRLIATPLVFLYCKIAYGYKIKNKKVLKGYKKKGLVMYGNHTLLTGDAFLPTLVNFPKKTYILSSQDAVSIKGIGTIVKMLGCIPVASELSGSMRCFRTVKTRVVDEKASLMIYPEAHIWPYCDFVRNFKDASFHYPVSLGVPSFCTTVVLKRRKFLPNLFKRPKIEVWVDGPFFAPGDLTSKEQQKWLRDAVYKKMVERSKLGNYTYIKYVKKEESVDEFLEDDENCQLVV